ncbi:hypothetical protein BGZ59_007435 [Podila verticillata]|nr:hypothetical protein BGZ59_007435 [Podila verticillata]KFH69430.1 hypothetical protein MVEG_04242 [Podila verticillata NRRL 6337]
MRLRRVQQQLHHNFAANGDLLVPDRSFYVQELANATGEAKKEAIPLSKTRKNGRKGAAATRPPEGTMMVCFGVAGKPTRIRLFKDAVTCDVSGWTILYVFQAIRKYDSYMAKRASCVGISTTKDKSMITAVSDCNKKGWNHYLAF